MKNNFKRCLALLLALMTIVGAFAIPVSAAEECNHAWELKETKPVTCTSSGYERWFCPLCQSWEARNVQKPTEHKEIKAPAEVKATCTTDGYKKDAKICSVCKTFLDTDTSKKLPKNASVDLSKVEKNKDGYHNWVKVGIKNNANPCEVDTYYVQYKCTVAGCTYADGKHFAEIEKEGYGKHDYKFTVTEATCGKEGSVVRVCVNCKVSTTYAVEKDDHNYTGAKVKYEQIPAKDGKPSQHKAYVECINCGNKKYEDAVDCAWKADWAGDKATCSYSPVHTRECKTCGQVEKKTIPYLPHTLNYSLPVGEPVKSVHTTDKVVHGYKEYRCTVCSSMARVYDIAPVSADITRWVPENLNDHDWSVDAANSIKPTCTVVGVTVYECTYGTCGAVKNVKADPAHWFPETWTDEPAKCGVNGYKYRLCTLCGTKEIGKTIEMSHKKHEKGDKVTASTPNAEKLGFKAATCFEGGVDVWLCKHCKEVYETKATPKLTGHTQKELEPEGKGCFDDIVYYIECDICGKHEVKRIPSEDKHANGDIVVLRPATCFEEGIEGYVCARCELETPTSKIPFDENNHVGVLTPSGKVPNNSNTQSADGKWPTAEFSCVETRYEWIYCDACHRNFRRPMQVEKLHLTEDVEVYYHNGKFCTGECMVEAGYGFLTGHYILTVSGSHTLYVDVDVESTCFSQGYGIEKCAGCSYVAGKVTLPLLEHDFTGAKKENIDPQSSVTAPDCTNSFSWRMKCNVCKEYKKFGTDKAKGHKYGDYTTTTPATCSAPGEKQRTCASCGNVDKASIAKVATAHPSDKVTEKKPYTEPDCTNKGYYATYECSACKKWFYKDHNDKDKIVNLTDKKAKEIAATGHQSYADAIARKNGATVVTGATLAPTCTMGGATEIICAKCNDFVIGYTDYTVAMNHNPAIADPSKGVQASDYTSEANKNNVVPATCTTYEYKYIKCLNGCGAHLYQDPNEAKPKAPHENADGGILTGDCQLIYANGDYKCKYCEKEFKPTHVDEKVKADACGGTRLTCVVCGDQRFTLKDANKPATHTWLVDESKSTAPTLTTKGYEYRYCAVCGYVEGLVDIGYLPAVTFNLDVVNANDDAAVIVNGGKIFVRIKMAAEDVSVNGIKLSLQYNPDHLTLLQKESEAIPSVFGAVTGGSSQPAVNEQKVGDMMVVTIYDEAGSIRDNVAIGDADLFATLVFQVKSSAFIQKDYQKTSISFYTGYGDSSAYKSQVTTKTADGYADNNFACGKAVEIKIKQLGDYNNDGLVDSKDVSAVADLAVYNFTEKKYDAVLDIDHDGDIDFDDYKYIKLFQVPGSYKGDGKNSEFYDVAVYEARLKAEAEAAKKDNVNA